LENGSIPRSDSLIIHNPDDIILDYPGSFPHDLVAAHVAGRAKRMLSTAVMAEGLPATYTGMRVRDGIVEEVMSYPRLPIPAHVGITVFSPSAYYLFEAHFGFGVKSDFESMLFPILVAERKLYTVFIPSECWLQVNDPKAWRKLIRSLTG
jgi:NDP-sugar pyrophosphorylase family protein